jgi:SAM-dependent methyltransferase
VSTQNNIETLSNCRACNSDSLVLAATRKKFPLYIWPLPIIKSTRLEDIKLYVCNECGYMQLQNMEPNTISEIYRDEVFNITNLKQNESRYLLITNSNKNIFVDKKVMEIGGGRNAFVTMLPKNVEKWVVDFSIEKSVKSIVNGYYTGDFNNLNINNKEFDFIFMFHVLEHFNNPGKALNKIRTLLKETGRLIVEVPNFGFESKNRPYYTLFHMHISLFTDVALTSMMARHGFRCVTYYKKDDVLLAEFVLENKKYVINHKQHSMTLIDYLQLNIENLYVNIKENIQRLEDGKVAIFGAGGTTTLFLYNFPFLIEMLSYAIDNDEKKLGRFICDGKIQIISSKDILKNNINNVLILDESHIQFMNNNLVNFINIGNFND